tara:strand:- start:502 stop:780 length:279 start_codon:yes stop_codon:yes gene_type:complete
LRKPSRGTCVQGKLIRSLEIIAEAAISIKIFNLVFMSHKFAVFTKGLFSEKLVNVDPAIISKRTGLTISMQEKPECQKMPIVESLKSLRKNK